MTAEQFAQECSKFVPTREQLEANKYSEDLILEFEKSFRITEKHIQLEENPLFDIIRNFDTNSFTVGRFYFLPEIEHILNYYLFGQNEADYMAIDENTNEIMEIGYEEVEEFKIEGEGAITNVYYCAKDSNAFLEALLIAIELFYKWYIENLTVNDVEISIPYAERCVERAGGEKYKNFWWALLGCN